MGSRYVNLQQTLEGFLATGVSLVGYDGKNFFPGGRIDDVGMYYFVPKLAVLFHVSLDQAVALFFHGALVLSFLLGLLGSFLLYRNWKIRLLASVSLLALTILPWFMGDLYTFLSVTAVALIPLFLAFVKSEQSVNKTAVFCFLSGLLIGISHYCRAHSGTAVLIFMTLILLFGMKKRLMNGVFLVCFMLIGLLGAHLFFQSMIHDRDAFLKKNQPGYAPVVARHPLWHNAYLGLAFMDNPYVAGGEDGVAMARAAAINPQVKIYSVEYENILRREFFQIAVRHPYFFIRNLFAKLGVLAFFFLIFCHCGIAAAIKFPKPWPEEAAFWSALGFHSVFGLLFTPYFFYVLGFVAFSALYGVHSVHFAREQISLR